MFDSSPVLHSLCTECPVVVLLGRFGVHLLLDLRCLAPENVYSVLVCRIDILLVRWHDRFDFVLVFTRCNSTEIGCGLVVSLSTPRHIAVGGNETLDE